jgi:hypothetical protein
MPQFIIHTGFHKFFTSIMPQFIIYNFLILAIRTWYSYATWENLLNDVYKVLCSDRFLVLLSRLWLSAPLQTCNAQPCPSPVLTAPCRSVGRYSPHFKRKSLRGGVGSGAVRGESLLVGGLKGCYWSKTVWRTRELHYYVQTENIKQLRVACSERTFTCTVGVVVIFYIESHWIHQNTWNTFVCCLFSGCGINAFRMASSISSLAEKSCACAYIAFLAGIFSWYADSTTISEEHTAFTFSPDLVFINARLKYK